MPSMLTDKNDQTIRKRSLLDVWMHGRSLTVHCAIPKWGRMPTDRPPSLQSCATVCTTPAKKNSSPLNFLGIPYPADRNTRSARKWGSGMKMVHICAGQ